MRWEKIREVTWEIVRILLSVSVVVWLWFHAVNAISYSDLAALVGLSLSDLSALLFGASSVALIAVSLIIAFLAILGWKTIQEIITQNVIAATDKKVRELEIETRGRVVAALGYMVGEMSTDPDTLEALAGSKYRLAEAIKLCEKGYNLLGKLDDDAGKYFALNNLLFFSCVDRERSRSRVDFLLGKACELLRVGQERDVINLQLTACRVILRFSEDEEEVRRAGEVVSKLLVHPEISDKENSEARLYLNYINSIGLAHNSQEQGLRDGKTSQSTKSRKNRSNRR